MEGSVCDLQQQSLGSLPLSNSLSPALSYKQLSSPAALEATSWKNRDLSLREYDTSQTAWLQILGSGVKVEASNHTSPLELARYKASQSPQIGSIVLP